MSLHCTVTFKKGDEVLFRTASSKGYDLDGQGYKLAFNLAYSVWELVSLQQPEKLKERGHVPVTDDWDNVVIGNQVYRREPNPPAK